MPRARPTDNQLLADLLADAKLVALYGQRAGILPDATLQQAIHDVEKQPTKSWADDSVLALQVALNKTMHELPHISLMELKGPSAPFTRSSVLTAQSIVFVLASVLLVVCAAWFTMSYNQGSALIRSIQRLDDIKAQTRIFSLARDIVTNPVNPGIPPTQNTDNSVRISAAILANYFSKTDEMESLDRDAQVVNNTANVFITQNLPVIGLWEGGLAGLWNVFVPQQPVAANGANLPEGGGAPCPNNPPPVAASTVIPAASTEFEAILTAISHTRAQSVMLTCADGLTFHIYDFPDLDRYLTQLQEVVNVYGLWLLPALYGALGASMFHLRRLLNPSLPNPSPLRLIYRFTVGAFAGIIIAWFWAPDTTAPGGAHIGFNVFAAAFLVGYGIDIFFALLDRLLNVLTTSIGQIGTSKPSDSSAG